jgi:hypothetical protein
MDGFLLLENILTRKCTFLIAKKCTSLFAKSGTLQIAKNRTFLFAKKCTLLFTVYNNISDLYIEEKLKTRNSWQNSSLSGNYSCRYR